MKPRPIIRKTIKWGGAVVTVWRVGVWFGSGWCGVRWSVGDGRGFFVSRGLLSVDFDFIRTNDLLVMSSHALPRGWNGDLHSFRMFSQFAHWHMEYRHHVTIPLWLPSLAAFSFAASGLGLDTLARRRAKLNLCPKCSYDRTGLAIGAKCPECGAL